MTHFRALMESDYLGVWDLPQDRDALATVESVKRGEVVNATKKKSKKPIIKFAEYEKSFVCNVTNAKSIAHLYGNDVEDWIGKRLLLGRAQVEAFGEVTDCIRVRRKQPPTDAPKSTGAKTDAADIAYCDLNGEAVAGIKSVTAWLTRAEADVAAAKNGEAGKSWDANSDTFYKLQARATEAGKVELIERFGKLSAEWSAKMNTEQSKE